MPLNNFGCSNREQINPTGRKLYNSIDSIPVRPKQRPSRHIYISNTIWKDLGYLFPSLTWIIRLWTPKSLERFTRHHWLTLISRLRDGPGKHKQWCTYRWAEKPNSPNSSISALQCDSAFRQLRSCFVLRQRAVPLRCHGRDASHYYATVVKCRAKRHG